ncbi:MAG: BamA/TamA family outer membrane protein [Cyclobacteriaceae bacterium]|nr:BamA/TamA family outer membrane protein [Cyclobacteriaceae bacterium]MCH8517722.1 BamA/TamA family outer membrane protein [Cyclobacteriaceae bacterium]
MRVGGLAFLFLGSLCLFMIDVKGQSVSNVAGEDSIDSSRVKIDKVFVIGNKRTRKRIITREMEIKSGGEYLRSELKERLARDKDKIRNTRLFLTIDISELEVDNETIDILVKVKERWYTFPLPLFDLADRNFNEWWVNQGRSLDRTIYGMKFYQENVRGMNEQLKITAQFGFARHFELRYSIPYLNRKQTHGLMFYGGYREFPNVNVQTVDHFQDFINLGTESLQEDIEAGAIFSIRNSFYNFHRFTLEYRDRKVADTVLAINPDFLLGDTNRQRFFRFSYAFTHDNRDNIQYALKGKRFTVRFDQFGLGLFNDINQSSLYAGYFNFKPLGKGVFLSNSVSGQTSFPSVQPYTHFRAMGFGEELVRGFELNVIEGQHYLLQRNTLRYQLLDYIANIGRVMPIDQFNKVPIEIYLKTFFDQGHVWNSVPYPLNERLQNRYLYGGGVGIDIVTFYDAVFRLERSWNAVGETGFFIHFRSDI